MTELHFKDEHGRQLVTTDYKLGYAWTGEVPLKVGDWVEVPGNSFNPYNRRVQVTGLGSTYDGHHQQVVERFGQL